MSRTETYGIWLERVKAYYGSGLSQKEFCQSRDINIYSLKTWITRLNHDAQQDESKQVVLTNQKWVQLTKESLVTEKEMNSPVAIEIAYEGFRIKIREGFTRETFTDIIKGLKSSC